MSFAHYLRCCLNCGSLFPRKGIFLCEDCWQQVEIDLAKSTVKREVLGRKIEATPIWNWIPEKNDALSNLLLALKGWSGKHEWRFLAKKMIQTRISLGWEFTKPDMLIPAPTFRKVSQDHAGHFAEALGQELEIPVIRALRKNGSGPSGVHQRGLKKMERQLISIKICENFSQQALLDRRIIFVDDVLTTGGTAALSLEALGSNKSYEIWCLAHRALV